MYKKILCCLLVVTLVLAAGGIRIILPVNAVPLMDDASGSIGTITTMNDFTDDCVMVVLTHEASLEFTNYTPADFPEIDCAEIEDLSSAKGAKVQAVLRGEQLEMDSIGARFMNQNIDIDGFRRILCLKLANPGKGNVLRAIAALEQREDVYSAEPNYIYQIDLPIETQAVIPPVDLPVYGWAAEKIEQEAAWEIETGSNSVLVGILDSGIDASHPELSGKVSTLLSMDFINPNAQNPGRTDSYGHGTMVAGIIAAKHNNNDYYNVSGVCQNVALVSLRVMEKTETGDTVHSSWVASAINYAEGKDIALLNLSFIVLEHSYEGNVIDAPLHAAISDFSGLLFCAAGNQNYDLNGLNYPTPGGWAYNNIITVGASTQSDTRWGSSNYDTGTTSAKKVDLFAPGDNILTCFPRSLCDASSCDYGDKHLQYGYHTESGTSLATPFVTGVAALILASHPDATPALIKDTILYSDDNVSALNNLCFSGGRLNAYKAITSKILHSDVSYTSINATYHRVSCNDCDAQWQEAHVERPGVEVCIYCQEYLW